MSYRVIEDIIYFRGRVRSAVKFILAFIYKIISRITNTAS